MGSLTLIRHFRFKTIERKILALILATCGTLLLVTGITFSYYEEYQVRQHQYQSFSSLIEWIMPDLSAALIHQDLKRLEQIMHAFRALPALENWIILDRKEQVLLSQHSADWPPHKHSDNLIYPYPITNLQGETIGKLCVVVSSSYVTAETGRVQLLLLIELVGLLMAGYLCAFFFTRQILQPIRALIHGAKQIQKQQHFNWQVPNPYYDEFGTLIDTFNTMLRQIEHMRRYLDDIINCMPSCLVGLSPAWEITTWNQVAANWSGCTHERAEQVGIGQALPMLQSHLSSIQEAMISQTITYIPAFPYEEKYYTAVIYPLSSADMGCMIRLDDCTTQVKMEHTLVQHEKMMSVGGLAAGMAHELNNPLGGILQQAQNLERRLLHSLPANEKVAGQIGVELSQIRAYCETRDIPKLLSDMQSLGQRASEITHRMLQFAKPAPQAMQLVSVRQLFDHTLSLIAHDPKLQSVIITEDIDPNVPDILCIASEIEQVLLNICINALHAMENCPKKILKLSAYVEDHYLCLQICDTGTGMDEVLLKKIFEPFFTTKPESIGTGLGLSVSYFIVSVRHRGDIFVTSTLGEGSCFKVCLPI